VTFQTPLSALFFQANRNYGKRMRLDNSRQHNVDISDCFPFAVITALETSKPPFPSNSLRRVPSQHRGTIPTDTRTKVSTTKHGTNGFKECNQKQSKSSIRRIGDCAPPFDVLCHELSLLIPADQTDRV